MLVFQDHTPKGVASAYFGGVIFRFAAPIEEGMPDLGLRHAIMYRSQPRDELYPIDNNLRQMLDEAKKYKMFLIVANLSNWFRPDITAETYGRVSGIMADILDSEGFRNNAAVALMNEPGKDEYYGHGIEGAKKYIQYVVKSNNYVKGRYPLILVNDEYHNIDENYIFVNTSSIPSRWFGVHHLSSLGNPPNWQNVIDAKTQANVWKVPVICNEGGSWFKKYIGDGNEVNKELIRQCAKYDYFGCAIVCVELTNQAYNNIIGYKVWDNNFVNVLTSADQLKYWYDFENFIKQYKKEEPVADRIIRLVTPAMEGADVKVIEDKLRLIGFDIKVNSRYESDDYQAVRVFQRETKIVIDGGVGPQTKGKLNETTLENFYPEVFKGIYGSKGYGIDAIDYFLDEYAHPNLAGHGKYFVQAEQETGIPAEWQLANGMQESGVVNDSGRVLLGNSYYGRSPEWKNLYGWAITDSGPLAQGRFETYAGCIVTVAHKIKDLFLNPANWRYNGDHIFGIEVAYSTASYNAINKAKWYRFICQFLDKGIMHKIPEYVEDLVPFLEKYFVRKN